MSELSFTVVEVPKTVHGRAAAPNPYAPAVDKLLSLAKGEAIAFQPLEKEHTDKLIMRRMRAVAPETVTLRSKWDEKNNTITVWATEKKPKPVKPVETAPATEGDAAAVTEGENATETAPETESAPEAETAPETAPEAEKPKRAPRGGTK